MPNPEPADSPKPETIPSGYRQGLITAITVFLAFSLGFFRFWCFESSGAWSLRSAIAAIALTVAVVLQIRALHRALRWEDDTWSEYTKTVRFFIASTVVLLAGLVVAAVVYAGMH